MAQSSDAQAKYVGMYRVWYVRPDYSYWTEWLPRPETVRLQVLEKILADPNTSDDEGIKALAEKINLDCVLASIECKK